MSARASTPPVPRRIAAASVTGAVLAALLVAAGAVGVRDAVVTAGWAAGTPWLPQAIAAASGAVVGGWVVTAAAVTAAVVGAVLLGVAVSPARRRGVAVSAQTGVFLDLAGVARLAAAAAGAVPGVVATAAQASRRRVSVRCEAPADGDPQLRTSVREAVVAAMAPLAKPPKVRVRVAGVRR